MDKDEKQALKEKKKQDLRLIQVLYQHSHLFLVCSSMQVMQLLH